MIFLSWNHLNFFVSSSLINWFIFSLFISLNYSIRNSWVWASRIFYTLHNSIIIIIHRRYFILAFFWIYIIKILWVFIIFIFIAFIIIGIWIFIYPNVIIIKFSLIRIIKISYCIWAIIIIIIILVKSVISIEWSSIEISSIWSNSITFKVAWHMSPPDFLWWTC